MDFSTLRKRLNAPQLQAQLLRLTDRTRLRRLKSTLLSAGSVLTPHDYTTNVQKRFGNRAWTGFGECSLCGSFLDPQLEHGETCSTAEATRGHCACVHAVVCDVKLADLGITTERRGLTASQSRPADIFTTAAVPGRSAATDVCVASPSAAAARGDAAQASFDRKFSHFRDEISDSRDRGTHNRPLFWTADGRPHPARTRTWQHAADTASNRNGQQMSAKSLQRKWKHTIQMALLRRRAPMTRAGLPNPSARAEWLLASIIDIALHHWGSSRNGQQMSAKSRDSVRRSSKRSFHDSLIRLVSCAWGHDPLQGCLALTSPTSGFPTWTRARGVS